MKKFIALTSAALAAATLTAFAEVSVDVTSAYVFRGATINDKVNVQPGFETTAFGDLVTVGTWANYNTDSSEFDEVDFYFSVPLPLGENSPVGVDVGYTEYMYPGSEGEADREPFILFSTSAGPVDASLGFYYGIDGAVKDSLYIELGLESSYALAENVSLGGSAKLGYLNPDEGQDGFSHLTLGASLGVTIPEIQKEITFGINYVIETDKDVLAVDEDFYFTVGFAL